MKEIFALSYHHRHPPSYAHIFSFSSFKCFPLSTTAHTFLKAQEKWNTRQCRLQHLLCSAINHWLSPLASKINLFPNLLFLFSLLIFLAILLRFIFLLPILAISNYSSTPWTHDSRSSLMLLLRRFISSSRMKWWNMVEVFPIAWINFSILIGVTLKKILQLSHFQLVKFILFVNLKFRNWAINLGFKKLLHFPILNIFYFIISDDLRSLIFVMCD